MNFRKAVEDKILFILFTYRKEVIAQSTTETAFDIIRKHGLKYEDFADQLNQNLYKSIQNQLYDGLPDVDFLRIVAYRPKEYKVFEQQANQYLSHITALISTNYASFSELDRLIYKLKEFVLIDFWRERSQIILTTNFDETDVVSFGDVVISDYQEKYTRLMSGVMQQHTSMNDIADDLRRRIQARDNGVIQGVPICLPKFQDFFGGWRAPDLIIIGARPSMGKTAFILASAWDSAQYSNIVFCTLEMSKRQIINKIAGNLTGVPYNNIENVRLTADQEAQVLGAYERVKQSKLTIIDIQFSKVEALKQEARRLHRLGKLDMLVIDYLQLMETEKKHQSREQEVSYISRQLKLLAIELNVPVIALAQVGRACEDRNDKRPMLSDLRESGAIEQDADIVAFLFREAYYFPKDIDIPYETKFKTEFIVAKGRNVGTKTLYFFSDVLNARILELETGY